MTRKVKVVTPLCLAVVVAIVVTVDVVVVVVMFKLIHLAEICTLTSAL